MEEESVCNAWAAGLSALLFSLAPLPWSYSTHAEVFALNNLLIASLLLLCVTYASFPRTSTACLGAFVIGLGLSNQHTFVLYAAPAVVWVTVQGGKQILNLHSFILLVLSGLAGLSPYLYLVWAAKSPPFGSWGNTSTLQGFIVHFFRQEYGTLKLYTGTDQAVNDLARVVSLYMRHLWQQSALCPLIPIGVIATAMEHRRWRSPGVLLGAMFGLYFLVFHSLANIPLDRVYHFAILRRFWIQLHIVAFSFAAPGLRLLLKTLGLWRHSLLAACCPLVIASHLYAQYATMDMSKSDLVERYGRAMLQNAPSNATLLVQGDVNCHTIRYLQACEGLRRDVRYLDQVLMTFDWYKTQQAPYLEATGIVFPGTVLGGPNPPPPAFSWEAFLAANWREGGPAILNCGGWHPYDDMGKPGVDGFSNLFPVVGLCNLMVKDGAPFDLDAYVAMADRAAEVMTFEYPEPWEMVADSWEHHVVGQMWEKRELLGVHMLELWNTQRHRRALQIAIREMRLMIRDCHWPAMPISVYKNLGAALSYEAGNLQSDGPEFKLSALTMQRESLDVLRAFLKKAPRDDPDRKVIKQHIRTAEKAMKPKGEAAEQKEGL